MGLFAGLIISRLPDAVERFHQAEHGLSRRRLAAVGRPCLITFGTLQSCGSHNREPERHPHVGSLVDGDIG